MTNPNALTAGEMIDRIVPHPGPEDAVGRCLLLAMRRIAAAGLDDATAANAMLGVFGLGYRRPLMFLRVLMEEVSRVSQQQIKIAPCCCPRMTSGEAAILQAVYLGRHDPGRARAGLAKITATLNLSPALSVAQALADALDDLGRPLAC